ncbi:protein of unknown function [uncultured Woeseiaceae bacterium]|uniref:Uncharacterized protein n=1 Tax=uncultured Woeseiaceae bacterium TaxID=1983305 RepID=A0A7D9H333_9GAMM|nr:protein of unknown function [uncultured Woeseiaceae bacterium]
MPWNTLFGTGSGEKGTQSSPKFATKKDTAVGKVRYEKVATIAEPLGYRDVRVGEVRR